MNDITKQALEYLKMGFSIIPLGEIKVVDDKKSITYPIAWTKYQNEHPTESDINLWFEIRRYPNIGIITGKISKLFVLDVDSYKPTFDRELLKSFNLPPTCCQTTGRGGKQYFFRYEGDARNAAGIFKEESCIDIRANGGMVIAPPSRIRTSEIVSSEYTWEVSPTEVAPQPLPEKLATLFKTQEKEKTDWNEFLTEKKPSGVRNTSLASLAGKLLYETSPDLWDTLAFPMLRQWNKNFNSPPLPDDELLTTWNSIKKLHMTTAPSVDVTSAPNDEEAQILKAFIKNKTNGTHALAGYITRKYNIITVGEKEREIFVYRDGIYFQAENEIIFPEIQRILQHHVTRNAKSETHHKICDMTTYPRSIFESASLNFIPLANGVYDTETKRLLPHDSKYKFKYKFPIIYNKDATCPKTLAFMEQILSPIQIKTVQEWIGYYFYRLYIFKKAIIFVGEGDTGKTTLLEVITFLLGRENISSVSLQKMTSDKFSAAHLYDKHGNIVDELSARDISDTGNFKIATGGGSINGEYKFGNQFSFHNFSKFTFACNKIPDVKDFEDEAYFNRWMVLRFEKTIEKKIPNFIATLTTEEERSGLFNWAMEGLERLMMNKTFTYASSAIDTKKEMLRSGSSIATFSADMVMQEIGAEMPKDEMYEHYTKYCLENQMSADTIKMFGTKFPFYVPYVAEGIITTIDGKRGRGWRNVVIKKDKSDENANEQFELL